MGRAAWRDGRTTAVVVVLVVLAATALRVMAAAGEPWLDEIWSLRLSQHATSAWQIVADPEFHIDNNHWLTTIWMHALGERTAWWPYRVPAVISGTALVVMAWAITRRWGRAATLAAVTFTGFSFVCVQYGSEARGYGPAAALAFVALWAARAYLDARTPRQRVAMSALFAVVCALGLVSHASFVYALAGAAAHAAVGLARRGERGPRWATRYAGLLAVPGLFTIVFYRLAIRGMRVAGGPREHLADTLAGTFRWTAGTWAGALPGPAALAVATLVIGYGTWALARRGRDEWAFLLTAGLIAPVVVAAAYRPELLYTRYLFVALPFLLLLAAAALDDLARRGPTGMIAAVAFGGVFLAGNVDHLRRFYADGRGHNRAAVQYLIDHTDGPDISLSAAQKFRTTMVFGYVMPRTNLHGKTLRYVPPQSPTPPLWFVVDGASDTSGNELITIGDWPGAFKREATFGAYGLAGNQWYLYRHVTPPQGR